MPIDERGLMKPETQDDAIAAAAAGGELASPEEVAAFQARFLRLLERRTAIYTQGDSTSVPTRVAADLLRSIAFVLGIDPDDPAVPEQLLSVDLEGEYRRRLDEIGRRVEAAEALWVEVRATMPLIDNIALRDTLANIGEFFSWYDYRSMAHETTVMIDYPLCHPVPESLLGIDYIEEYLRRLLVEARLLAAFEPAAIERVLRASFHNLAEDLVNLYEPVATNALGLALVGKEPAALKIAEGVRSDVAERLAPMGRAEREKALRAAAVVVCAALRLDDDADVAYLSDLVPELLPRIDVALSNGELRGVFAG